MTFLVFPLLAIEWLVIGFVFGPVDESEWFAAMGLVVMFLTLIIVAVPLVIGLAAATGFAVRRGTRSAPMTAS